MCMCAVEPGTFVFFSCPLSADRCLSRKENSYKIRKVKERCITTSIHEYITHTNTPTHVHCSQHFINQQCNFYLEIIWILLYICHCFRQCERTVDCGVIASYFVTVDASQKYTLNYKQLEFSKLFYFYSFVFFFCLLSFFPHWLFILVESLFRSLYRNTGNCSLNLASV